MMKKYKIYRDYISRTKQETATDVGRRHGVERWQVHQAVKLVRDGSKHEFNECMKDIRLTCLWESKYKVRYEILKKMRKTEMVISEMRDIYHRMVKDGFTPYRIAKLTGKDNSTIRHHLNNVKL